MSVKVPEDHRRLVAWQKSFSFAAEVYRQTGNFPQSEIYGLGQQMRRSAVSVVSNIAEGAGRRTTRDFVHFLHIARGSLAELETQALLAQQIGLMNPDAEVSSRLDEIGRLLNGLIRSLEQAIANGTARR